MLYSAQEWFCSCCGKKQKTVVAGPGVGCYKSWNSWRTCSRECCEEMEWRTTLSIMGKEYYPKPKNENPLPY